MKQDAAESEFLCFPCWAAAAFLGRALHRQRLKAVLLARGSRGRTLKSVLASVRREGAISLIQIARACISNMDELAIAQQYWIGHARSL